MIGKKKKIKKYTAECPAIEEQWQALEGQVFTVDRPGCFTEEYDRNGITETAHEILGNVIDSKSLSRS